MLRGQPITGIEPRCGMVFQSYALFPWKTVRGNVEFGLKMQGVARAERRERAQRFIDMVKLTGFEDRYPTELSGGMQQRVTLARILAADPEVLLMDEPFAALDAMTRQVMQEELLRIHEASGKTTVFITHSIDEALILSDRIVVMSARPGRIKAILPNPPAASAACLGAALARVRGAEGARSGGWWRASCWRMTSNRAPGTDRKPCRSMTSPRRSSPTGCPGCARPSRAAGLDWLLVLHPVSIRWLIGQDTKSYTVFQCLPVSAEARQADHVHARHRTSGVRGRHDGRGVALLWRRRAGGSDAGVRALRRRTRIAQRTRRAWRCRAAICSRRTTSR